MHHANSALQGFHTSKNSVVPAVGACKLPSTSPLLYLCLHPSYASLSLPPHISAWFIFSVAASVPPWFICLWSLLTLSNTFLFFPSSPSNPALFSRVRGCCQEYQWLLFLPCDHSPHFLHNTLRPAKKKVFGFFLHFDLIVVRTTVTQQRSSCFLIVCF